MSKPLKFDPILLEHNVAVVASKHNPGCIAIANATTGAEDTAFASKDTAALIAALQVAHKAQLEAEILTFADLKHGEWFRFVVPGNGATGFIPPSGVCKKLKGGGYFTNRVECFYDASGDLPVVRVRATFEDEKP